MFVHRQNVDDALEHGGLRVDEMVSFVLTDTPKVREPRTCGGCPAHGLAGCGFGWRWDGPGVKGKISRAEDETMTTTIPEPRGSLAPATTWTSCVFPTVLRGADATRLQYGRKVTKAEQSSPVGGIPPALPGEPQALLARQGRLYLLEGIEVFLQAADVVLHVRDGRAELACSSGDPGQAARHLGKLGAGPGVLTEPQT